LTLAEGEQSQGHYKILFENKNLPSGTYFYRLRVNDQTLCRRMVILK
jgi:hypothetical protein